MGDILIFQKKARLGYRISTFYRHGSIIEVNEDRKVRDKVYRRSPLRIILVDEMSTKELCQYINRRVPYFRLGLRNWFRLWNTGRCTITPEKFRKIMCRRIKWL